MKKLSKAQVSKLVDKMDFEGLSKAYMESEIAWSAKEWKKFIKIIRAKQKKETMGKVKNMPIVETNDPDRFHPQTFKDTIDQVIKTIK